MAKDSSRGLSYGRGGGADTIVARATAAGHGALAVVRVSGELSEQIARTLSPKVDCSRPWTAQLAELRGPGGEVVERAIVIPYRGPRSYTGEDMLELIVHGSPYLVERVVGLCELAGARPAEAGEFTRRAVANGKMDVLQAEGVRDLIAAETEWQARVARAQMGGAVSRRLERIRDVLVEVLARVEAAIDLGEEELAIEVEALSGRCREAAREVSELAATAAVGMRLREGVRVFIVGEPNVGKSTMFNRLVGRERSIVSALPGTTRDLVEGRCLVGGVPVVVVDGAGITDSTDEVEVEGVRRAEEAAVGADALIVLWSADRAAPPRWPGGVPFVGVRSKADLGVEGEHGKWLPVSAITGRGWEELMERLRAMVGVPETSGDSVAVSRRHFMCLRAVARALRGCEVCEPEVAAEQLRSALGQLREVGLDVGSEEVLDEVFSSFCVGK